MNRHGQKRGGRLLAMLLVVAMVFAMVPTALAAGTLDDVLAAGNKGTTSANATDISGLLALDQYVFESADVQSGADGYYVEAGYYGVYVGNEAAGANLEASYVVDSYDGIGGADAIAVYLDSACTEAAEGVTAQVDVAASTLTISGIANAENTVYYLSLGGGYATAVYVVGDSYSGSRATLTLADGSTIPLTTYAPNLQSGSYTASQSAVNADGSVFIGGNKSLVSAADYGFTGAEAAAVDWFLQSGITNAGDSLEDFGDSMYVNEYAMAMYRMFQIVVDLMTTHEDYVAPADYSSGMFVNDIYSDALDATIQAGVWNGLYTEMSNDMNESMVFAASDGANAFGNASVLGKDEFYLLTTKTGVDTDASGNPVLGTGRVLDIEYTYVALYNALTSVWSMVDDSGASFSVSGLERAAADYDGGTPTAPADYSNEAKIYAVLTQVMGESGSGIVGAADQEAALLAALGNLYTIGTAGDDYTGFQSKLSKVEAICLLYAASDAVQSKTSPDSSWASGLGSGGIAAADMSRYYTNEVNSASAASSISDWVVATDSTNLLNNLTGGRVVLTNTTVSSRDSGSAFDVLYGFDPNSGLDGAEAAMGTGHPVNDSGSDFYNSANPDVGFVYNATARNAFYRNGIGSGLSLWGDSTRVVMTSTDGTLSIDAEGSSAAGGVYVGYGAMLTLEDTVTYSANQHLTNNLYNGTVYYLNAYEVASGRAYSSDFWGGYHIYESSIVEANGHFIDEPTSVVVKDSVYSSTLGGTGMASFYAQNSVVNGSTVSFSNNTSGITDTAAVTFVNSTFNNESDTLASVTRGNRAVVTLVDSDVTLDGNSLATVGNWTTGTSEGGQGSVTTTTVEGDVDDYLARFNGQVTYKIYGDNTITTSDGTLTAAVGDGAGLTIYGDVVDASGAAMDLNGISGVTHIPGGGYGTLTVLSAGESGALPYTDVSTANWFYDAVLYTYENGLMTGTTDTLFEPNLEMSRAMMVTVLYRYEGEPAVTAANEFTDVRDDYWYTDAILWAYEHDIVEGYGDGLYGPNDDMTRQQMAAIFMRYAQWKGLDTSASNDLTAFTDADQISNWALGAMRWANAEGLITGVTDTTIEPGGTASRAQVATVLMRFIEDYVK